LPGEETGGDDYQIAFEYIDQILTEAGYFFIPPSASDAIYREHTTKTFCKIFITEATCPRRVARVGRTPSGTNYLIRYDRGDGKAIIRINSRVTDLSFGDPLFPIKLVAILQHDGNIGQ
jgi:hypothetical protein